MARAVELAVANNGLIGIAESDIAIANESRRQAHRTRGITVSAAHSSEYADYMAFEKYGQSYQNSYSNAIKATYPLYTGGVITHTIDRAESEYESKKESMRKTLQDMRQSVADALYSVLRADDMAKLNAGSVERLVAHVDNVRIQYENGKVGKADLLSSEVELSNSRQNLIRANNDYDAAVKQLNSQMGMPLDTKLRINETLKYEKFAHTLEECVESGRANHPELIMAALAIESAESDSAIARGEKRPKASVTATQNLSDNSSWPGGKADSFNIALNAEFTIFDSGVASSKIAAADAALKRARHNYDVTLDARMLAIDSDYNGIIEASKRLDESIPTIGKAQEAYDIALDRYNEGVGTNIDVVDSQTALTQANSNYTQALCDYNIALSRLENSMGGEFKMTGSVQGP
ncbi:MAG: TolC family protein [Synergistaceae bacterium]|nr:TolC family protein [Synergistaceae bacterium]